MSEKLTRNVDLKPVLGEWAVWHRYTYGVAGEKFFREMKNKARLVASVCPKCQKKFLPPSLYCEDCFVEMTKYKPVDGAGEVASFTVLHQSLDETPLSEPLVIALVRWNDVTGGWLAPLLNIDPTKVRVGLKVKPVFAKKRNGQIGDLAGFEVAD
jgi:uncharacterized OB-fold protein